MYTLSNDFHGTKCRVTRLFVDAANIPRVRRKLCPSWPECSCAHNDLGTRGAQHQPDGRLVIVQPRSTTAGMWLTVVDNPE